jgi:hypothetical protein
LRSITLIKDGQTLIDPKIIEDILNKQFDSVFSRPQHLSLFQSCKELLTSQKKYPKMPNVNKAEDEVKKVFIKGVKPSKVSGSDHIFLKGTIELHIK